MDGRIYSWILSLRPCLCSRFVGCGFDPASPHRLALPVAALLLLHPSRTGVGCLQCENFSLGKILATAEMVLASGFFLPLGLAVPEEQRLSIIGAPFIRR